MVPWPPTCSSSSKGSGLARRPSLTAVCSVAAQPGSFGAQLLHLLSVFDPGPPSGLHLALHSMASDELCMDPGSSIGQAPTWFGQVHAIVCTHTHTHLLFTHPRRATIPAANMKPVGAEGALKPATRWPPQAAPGTGGLPPSARPASRRTAAWRCCGACRAESGKWQAAMKHC